MKDSLLTRGPSLQGGEVAVANIQPSPSPKTESSQGNSAARHSIQGLGRRGEGRQKVHVGHMMSHD